MRIEQDQTFSPTRDWVGALQALRRLLADGSDTEQVFRIVRKMNAGSIVRNYARLLATPEGGRIAFARQELAPLLGDAGFLARFDRGSVGAAYAQFLQETGYSAEGLAEISRRNDALREAPHPYAWFGRRQRDTHDVWHVLTGYRADEPLGEACLVAFTYAQMRSAGWRLIMFGAMFKALTMPDGLRALGAMIEGYRHGSRARWLPNEDYEALLTEPLDAARTRLRIDLPVRYLAIQALPARR